MPRREQRGLGARLRPHERPEDAHDRLGVAEFMRNAGGRADAAAPEKIPVAIRSPQRIDGIAEARQKVVRQPRLDERALMRLHGFAKSARSGEEDGDGRVAARHVHQCRAHVRDEHGLRHRHDRRDVLPEEGAAQRLTQARLRESPNPRRLLIDTVPLHLVDEHVEALSRRILAEARQLAGVRVQKGLDGAKLHEARALHEAHCVLHCPAVVDGG